MQAHRFTMRHSSSHCTAAACTSARICMVMDTAIILVVSIFMVCLLNLRLWLPA